MNEDKLSGEGRDIVGKIKETAGDLTGDGALQGEGLADQLGGKVQKVVGVARDALAIDDAPLLDQAARFVRENPYVVGAVAGLLGLAIFNALRGNR